MSDKLRVGDEEWSEVLKPLIGRHYTPEQRALLTERGARAKEAGYDGAAIVKEWEFLFEEARALQTLGDRSSIRAQELGRRWMRMSDLFTDRDPEISERAQALWADAMADPELGPRLPAAPDLFRFVGSIIGGMMERGEWTGSRPT